MVGNQFGFNFSSKKDIDNLFTSVISRLEDYFSAYNLTNDDIIYIQISLRKTDQKLLSKFYLDKPLFLNLILSLQKIF